MKGLLPKVGLAASLLTFVQCATLNAGTIPGGFTQIDLGGGGFFPDLVQHWSGRLYGRTDGGGVYSSDNGGNQWKYLSGNFTSSAALDVQGIAVQQTINSSSNVVLQACGASFMASDPGRGIWKTTDGGATWTQTLTGVNFTGSGAERLGGECIIFNPTNDSEAWAGSYAQGLWKSANAGSSWTQVSSLTTNTFASLFISPIYTNQILAGCDGGLWGSTDHGATWTMIYACTVVHRVTRASDGTVYFCGNNGSTEVLQKITSANWGTMSWATPSTFAISSLLAAFQNGNNRSDPLYLLTVLRDGRLVVGDGEGITRISSNQGTNWTSVSMSYAVGSALPCTVYTNGWVYSNNKIYPPNSIVQDVTQPNVWYSGGGNGPICSTNGGTNWQYIVNGVGEVVAWKVCFHPTDPNRIYVGQGDNGGGIITDGGISGNTVSDVMPNFPNSIMCAHRALSSKSNGVNRVIFPGGEEFGNTARIYVSTNDGTSWSIPAMTGLPTAATYVIVDAIDSLDTPDDYLVVVGGNTGGSNSPAGQAGIYRTTNAGTNFTQCAWWPTNSVSLGGTGYHPVSIDRDATNNAIRYFFSHAAFPSGTYSVNNGGGFWVSYDRGSNWIVTTGVNGAIVSQPTHDWSDWQGTMVSDHAISGSVWIGFTPGYTALAHSVNYGTNFAVVGSFTNVTALDAYNGKVVVCGQMSGDTYLKIYYSSNSGTSWNEITRAGNEFAGALTLALDPYRAGRVFITSSERSVGIFTPGTPEQQWQLNYFMSTNSGLGANGADPDGNGLPNLVQYALGGDPLHGLTSDPLTGSASGNATNWLPYATISTNSSLAGQPVMRVNLPDPPPADIILQALSSTDLVNWTTNATRTGTNAWQAISPALVLPGLDANGRAIFDIGALPQDTNGGEYQVLQVQLAH